MAGLPKILNVTNTVFALIIIILSIVSLNGVNWYVTPMKKASWAVASKELDYGGAPYKISMYLNLYGSVYSYKLGDDDTNDEKSKVSNVQCEAKNDPSLSDGMQRLNGKGCSAYELRDTFYAFVVLPFVFALVKMVLAAVAPCKPARPVPVGNIICSFFPFLWSLVPWTLLYSKVYPQDLKFDAGLGELSYSMGPGFQSTIALCWFAFANIFVSIVHMVTAGNEEGGGGGGGAGGGGGGDVTFEKSAVSGQM